MFIKKLSLVAASFLLASNLIANDMQVNIQEVASYAFQKYRVDFNAQTDKSKQDIVNEYAQTMQLSSLIADAIKDDIDIKVATKVLSIDIWAQKYMASINPSDDELKKIYAEQQPKTAPRYNLRNILTKDETTAEKLIKQITPNKDKAKQLAKFKELVKTESIDIATKTKDGQIGFVDSNKLDKGLQEALKDKNSGDIVKVNMPNIGTQVILVEEYQPQRVATLEEAKQVLINIARQDALKNEIARLSKTK